MDHAQYIAELAKKDEALAQAHQEIKLLREKIDKLIHRIFGSSSEKMDAAQLELLLNLPKKDDELGKASGCAAMAPLAQPENKEPRKKRVRKVRLPEHLPVIEEEIIPEPVKACPQAWRRIGEEISETLDFEPAKFLKRRVVRPKFVKRRDLDAVPIIAPLPPILQERCIAAPGLIAQIIVAKYCDHLPLYRQEQIYSSRHAVDIPRQTMVGWLALAADWLKPVYKAIRSEVMTDGYLQIDETPIEYLDPGNGETRQGYFWVVSGRRRSVLFHWETSRAAACLEKIVPANFTGVIQCDGYSAYPAFAASRPAVELAGCWAHARRKFYEAREEAPQQARWLLHQIQHLYRIEAELRENNTGPRLREALRASSSRMIQQRLHNVLLRFKTSKRFLPQSGMGKAIDYALGQWNALSVWLRNGRVEIDNNGVENAIRPSAVGKKNWLFMGAAQAGERGAILYTIIENCRRCGIDPYAYLRDVLTRLPSMTNWQVPQITPSAWLKSKQAPQTRASAA